MGICRKFENWHDLRALSGKFLRQKTCCPESFRFFWLWVSATDTWQTKRIKTGPNFWGVAFAIEAIIDITDALLPTIAQHFNLFQSFKAEANDGG